MEEVCDPDKYGGIPFVVDATISWLEKYGLHEGSKFNIDVQKQDLEDLKNALDNGSDKELNPDTPPEIVCGVLKDFLGQLPEPILTNKLQDIFLSIHCMLYTI